MKIKVKWKYYYVFVILLAARSFGMFIQRHCNHLYPKAHEILHGVQIEPAHIMKKRSIDQSLRILLYYDESVYRLVEEKFVLINNTVLPEAVHFWEEALMVRKTENTIRLDRKCVNNEVFILKSDEPPYCKYACEEKTYCGEVQVPEEHLEVCKTCSASGTDCSMSADEISPGIQGADFMLYVSALQTDRCNKGLTVAYAAHCQQELALDRPIAGHVNLCPESISTKSQELENLISTVKHEILHALGFSVSLFAFYRDDKGNPLTPRENNGKPKLNEKLKARQWSDKVIKTVIRRNWTIHGGVIDKEIQVLVTPRVVKEVRKHFNCSILEGAELEDQGGEGTALTHWEKRLFENEAMTGAHTQAPVYSRLTMALLEDTGWYKANYSMAEELTWGKNLGCDFAMKSCKSWMDTKRKMDKSIHPFCNKVKQDPLHTDCTDDRTSVALCNLVKQAEPLPSIYQNFNEIPGVKAGKESLYGGAVSLADYCPYIQSFTWRSDNVVIRGSHCQYPENNPDPENNFALELYGNNSRCFDHTDQMWEEQTCVKKRYFQHWGSGCYKYKCANGRLNIQVGNYSYTCYFAGQELVIKIMADGWLHKGVVLCPPCEDLCKETFEKIGEWCKSSSLVPTTAKYQRDQLVCSDSAVKISTNIFIFMFTLLRII